MKIKTFIILLTFSTYNAAENKSLGTHLSGEFFSIPVENTMTLIDRNENILKEVLQNLSSGQLKTFGDQFRKELTSYKKNLDDLNIPIRNASDNRINQLIERALLAKKDIESCIEERKRNPAIIKDYHELLMYKCLSIFANKPLIIDLPYMLWRNATSLLEVNKQFRDQVNVCLEKDESSKTADCLIKVRFDIETTYSYAIMPLKRVAEEFPSYCLSMNSHIARCTNNNLLAQELWKKLDHIDDKFESCVQKILRTEPILY